MKKAAPHYVCGHRSPDTDAIVSAYALAWLHRQRYPNSNAQAIRLGDANRQTDWLFTSSNCELPPVRMSCLANAGEIFSEAPQVGLDMPLREALENIQRMDASFAVVCDEEQRPIGIVSNRHPRTNYLLQCNVEDFFGTLLDFSHIVQGLPLEALNSSDVAEIDRLEVVMHKHTFAGEWNENTVLVLGDRDLLLEKIIQQPPAAVVLLGMDSVRAREIANQLTCPTFLFKGSVVNLCARLPGCVPCETALEPNFPILKADTDLLTLEKAVRAHPLGIVVVDAENRFMGTLSADDLLSTPRPKLSLVDHSERRQSIDGLDRAEIIEILDHHRLGDIETHTPIAIDVRPVGSTATILFARIRAAQLKMPKHLARLLLGALISDTLLLTSPTTTPTDKEAAKHLADISGVDLNAFGLEVLRQNDELASASAAQLVARDCKEFHHGTETSFLIAQIETVDLASLSPELVDSLRDELLKRVLSARAVFGIVMVTDVIKTCSRLILATEDPQFQAAFALEAQEAEANCWQVEGMVSRKKQLLPWVFECLQKQSNP